MSAHQRNPQLLFWSVFCRYWLLSYVTPYVRMTHFIYLHSCCHWPILPARTKLILPRIAVLPMELCQLTVITPRSKRGGLEETPGLTITQPPFPVFQIPPQLGGLSVTLILDEGAAPNLWHDYQDNLTEDLCLRLDRDEAIQEALRQIDLKLQLHGKPNDQLSAFIGPSMASSMDDAMDTRRDGVVHGRTHGRQ